MIIIVVIFSFGCGSYILGFFIEKCLIFKYLWQKLYQYGFIGNLSGRKITFCTVITTLRYILLTNIRNKIKKSILFKRMVNIAIKYTVSALMIYFLNYVQTSYFWYTIYYGYIKENKENNYSNGIYLEN